MTSQVTTENKSTLKQVLKKVPGLVALKRSIWNLLNLDGKRGRSKLDLMASFPLYQPCSLGTYNSKAQLPIQTINQLIPALWSLMESFGFKRPKTQVLDELLSSEAEKRNAADFKVLLDKYQSDKATTHNYYILYSDILKSRSEVKRVFEIGLGTNNINVVSNMGPGGKPGASLRAFRDFLENAEIFGADIDKRVLFSEERIKTYWIDQTDKNSFQQLNHSIPNDFDLMIDDGLHSPNANLHSLEFFLPKLRIGGWAIIEDIGVAAQPLWEIVGAALPSKTIHFIASYLDKNSHVYLAQSATIHRVQRNTTKEFLAC